MTPAQLVIVGTPIGNLGDWSSRAQQVIAQVGLIACEDTRRTGLLLSKHGIVNPGLVVMNEHTERQAAERVLDALRAGVSVAIVTDAGMPTISDPGALVVDAAATAGFDVIVVPGPTAGSAALALSGFAGGRYVFEGFLPRKGKERNERLDELANERRIIVLYEAPHRVTKTLAELAKHLDPNRRCVVARELTKLYEDVWRGRLGDAATAVGDPRGEYVVVIDQAAAPPEASDAEIVAALNVALAGGASRKDAAIEVGRALRVGRSRAYELAVGLARSSGSDAP